MNKIKLMRALVMLERRGIITTKKKDAKECCGIERDDDGFCKHRGYHPIYIKI